MNKILVIVLTLLSVNQAFGYKFWVWNNTRGNVNAGGSPGGSIRVTLYTVGGTKPHIVDIPAGEYREIDTWTGAIGYCLSKVEARGTDGVLAGLPMVSVDVPWNISNSCHDRDIYVTHQGYRYLAPQAQQSGSGTQVIVGSTPVQYEPGHLAIDIAGQWW
jgi:hypothetical protein